MNTAIDIKDVPAIARRAGQLSDRAWIAILISFGLCALAAMMWRFDALQREQMEFFQTTMRQNTEALTRAALVMERLERRER